MYSKFVANIANILVLILLTILAIIFIFPVIWLLSGAFKPTDLIWKYPPVIIPPNPTISHFVELLSTPEIPFLRYLFNSSVVATVVTFSSVSLQSMAGYSFARLRYSGRDLIFIGVLATLMVPFYAIIIPLFIMMKMFGWIDTYMGLIIPMIPHGLGIFFYRQYCLGLPKELEDAAKIDGCSIIGIYWRVVLPLSKPIFLTLVVLTFIIQWDSFLWPLVVTQSIRMRVIQVGLAALLGEHTRHYGLVLAGTVIAIIPSVLFFLFLQKYLVQSVKLSGLKG